MLTCGLQVGVEAVGQARCNASQGSSQAFALGIVLSQGVYN
jgi:hypothetical protein